VVKDLLERVKKLEAGEAQTRPATASPQVSTPTRAPTNSPKPSPMPQAPVTAPASAASQSNHESFLDYLSPGSKGMFISSQAKLAKVDAGSAYIEMPTKFGFLKAKLESRAEEFLSAISKDSGTEVKSFNIELMEMKEAVSPRLEKQTVQVKPLKEEMNLSEKIPEPSQERVLAESSGEACVNRPETESFSGALQETQNTPSHQETKLKEAADAALTIFGGREV